MRIPQETIFAIEEATHVEEVLGDFLSLQKKGKKYFCPFHQDNHPSFSITADGKFYKCFSCQAKGNAIGFLMEQQGMHYPQALEYLAKKYGIPWEVKEASEQEVAQAQAREALYILLEKAQAHYAQHLVDHPDKPAYQYLKKRGFADPKLLDKFGLGYSLPAWRDLYDFATQAGYDDKLLTEAGLILTKENAQGEKRSYDRFRGRLMFPIYNTMGRVIGFGGRHLGAADDRTPKYINSPETPVYHKSHVLYGLYQAKQAIKKHDTCYLVEGYTDVLAMHQAGIEHVVASGGTALTPQQVNLVRRFTQRITLLFDGDAAGQAAALRGIDLLLAQGCDIKIVCLPSGEDPDSLRRQQGNEALQQHLTTHAQDFITFQATHLFQAAGQDPAQQAAATTTLLTTIAAIPDALKRTFYIQACSQRLGLTESLLQDKLQQLIKHPPHSPKTHPLPKPRTPDKTQDTHPTASLERKILYFLLHYATHAIDAQQRLADHLFQELHGITFSSLPYQTLWDQFKTQWHTQGPLSTETFLATQNAHIEETAREIMRKDRTPSPLWESKYGIMVPREEDNLLPHVAKDIKQLKRALLTQAIQHNMQRIDQATTEEEKTTYFEENAQLIQAQHKLAKDLGTVVIPYPPLSPPHALPKNRP